MGLKELVDEQMAAYHQGDYADHGSAEDMLTRFANAVAAVEREECARVCHLYAVDNRIHSLATRGAHDCEKAIRMRSNVEHNRRPQGVRVDGPVGPLGEE